MWQESKLKSILWGCRACALIEESECDPSEDSSEDDHSLSSPSIFESIRVSLLCKPIAYFSEFNISFHKYCTLINVFKLDF